MFIYECFLLDFLFEMQYNMYCKGHVGPNESEQKGETDGMPRPKEDVIRYRFAVPTQDASVHEWLESQMNMSMSLRLLIKEDIMRNGCTDMTCRTVEQIPKRGRPSTADVDRLVGTEDEEVTPPPKKTKSRAKKKQVVTEETSEISYEKSMEEVPEEEQPTVMKSPKVEQNEEVAAETNNAIASMFAGSGKSAQKSTSTNDFMGLISSDD